MGEKPQLQQGIGVGIVEAWGGDYLNVVTLMTPTSKVAEGAKTESKIGPRVRVGM